MLWMTACDHDSQENISGITTTSLAFKAEEGFAFEVDGGHRSRLQLQAINGEVSISGSSESDSVVITGTKRIESASAEDAEAHLPELDVKVRELADEVFVETIQPNGSGGQNYIVDYTIILPKNFEIQVSQVNGIVTIESMTNTVAVTLANGTVTLDDIVGSASVTAINGKIDGDVTLPLDGTITMSTTNGTIVLGIPQDTSAAFSARAGFGDKIRVSNLVLQNEVRTSTSLSGTLGDGQGTIVLTTVTGSIQVAGF
jgi:DUF4097 and DUF4098 domain-containing protein YvlB